MSLQLIHEQQSFLNFYVTETIGKNIAFKIHYWGGYPEHRDHLLHKHSHFEVCYVTKGEGIYEENGQEYVIVEHTLFLSRPGLWHKISSTRGIGLIWIAFELIEDNSSQNILQKLMESKTVCILGANENTSILFWNHLLKQAAEPGKNYLDEQLPSLTHVMLISFFQEFTNPTEKAAAELLQPFAERIHSQLLYKVKRFIRDNLSQTIHLKDIAAYFNISERQLIRLFRQETGFTFSAYLQKERIKQATSLMQTTILTLKEIADVTGYSSIHHFTNVFKKETGETPAQFRKHIHRP